jgi:rubrerythrin
MDITDTAVQAVDVLKEHEQAIGRLYAAYARRFPQDSEFWLSLSQEEEQHARWIESVQARLEQGPCGLVVNRFPIAAIRHSIRYIDKLIDGTNRVDLTPIKALSSALDIERALLENRYFEVFESDSAEVRRLLTSLARSTKAHCQRVQQAWRSRTQGSDHRQALT